VHVETPKAGLPEAPKPRVIVILERELAYDQYTPADSTYYGKKLHVFQWDKMREGLHLLDSLQLEDVCWAILQNKANRNGVAPLPRKFRRNEYENVVDSFGVEHYQSVPLFVDSVRTAPYRYGRDGSLVRVIWQRGDTVRVAPVFIGGEWLTLAKYVRILPDSVVFTHAIFADRTNQNITTVEKMGAKWLVRSMNPATTGVRKPPYMRETPTGIFVLQEKRLKMVYLADGSTTQVEGFAPYANRFCCGAYVHGVPVQDPTTLSLDFRDFSPSLGTRPRSHMCVRTATSHAKFIFERFPVEATAVFVIE